MRCNVIKYNMLNLKPLYFQLFFRLSTKQTISFCKLFHSLFLLEFLYNYCKKCTIMISNYKFKHRKPMAYSNSLCKVLYLLHHNDIQSSDHKKREKSFKLCNRFPQKHYSVWDFTVANSNPS